MLLNGQLQMEMAVKDTYHNRVKLLSELPNRDCIVRVTKNGAVIPAFRARTMNFESIPRKKNQIISKVSEKVWKEDKNKKIKRSGFSLGNSMSSQSTSRRKISYE